MIHIDFRKDIRVFGKYIILFFSREKEGRIIHVCNIFYSVIWTILFHMSKNEMVLRFEVALDVEKRGFPTSLQEKRNYFPNNPIIPVIANRLPLNSNGSDIFFLNFSF